MLKIVKGGVTTPLGFRASSREKLALLFSPVPCRAAGIFTTNALKAAPVVLSQERLKSGVAQAIVINSGNANALTGKKGLRDAELICNRIASILNLDSNYVLAASTGIIGKLLPVKKILSALPQLADRLSRKGGSGAALSIMTTDTFKKELAVEIAIGKKALRIGGMAKGAGMISPNMATMLCFLTTDAAIEPSALKGALKSACEDSFNSITIDGDMSTNDSCFLMSNSLAGNDTIKQGTEDYKKFVQALSAVTIGLAKMIVEDGEGSTKFVTIRVSGARNKADALRVARSIGNSPLVKTAIFGADPNWGRIASSIGASGVKVKEKDMSISIQKRTVFRNGSPAKFEAASLRKLLKKRDVDISVGLNSGAAKASLYTTDLSPRYVRINSSYPS